MKDLCSLRKQLQTSLIGIKLRDTGKTRVTNLTYRMSKCDLLQLCTKRNLSNGSCYQY